MATVVWSSLSLGWDSNFRAHIKGTKTGRSSQGKSRKMQGSNKLPKRGVEVRTSEREGRREGWRREKELLSHYYPSVTGLLGSCYGYRDSRLSVLLTIAHKGGIQLWATMQISLSLSLSFYIFFFSTSVYIFCLTYTSFLLFFCSSLSVSQTSQTATLPPSPPLPTTAFSCCLLFLSFILSLTLLHSSIIPLPPSP